MCDNLSGTLVFPFFAAAAYRAGLVSRALAPTVVASSLLVFVAYRGMNLLFPGETTLGTIFGLGFYGLIWRDVNVAPKLLRIRAADLGRVGSYRGGSTAEASPATASP